MNKVSINARVITMAATGISLILGLAALIFWSLGTLDKMDARRKAFADIAAGSKALQIKSLEARRSEKDLLIRHEIKYAAMAAKAGEETIAMATAMGRLPELAPAAAHIRSVETGMATYVRNLNAVAAAMTTAGLDEESGLQGELRTAVHKVEKAVAGQGRQDLVNHMLMLRRHEKDYLLRGNLEYRAKIEAEAAAFLDNLQRSDLPSSQKSELRPLIEAYALAIGKMIDADQSKRKAVAEMSSAYASFAPAFDKIADFAIAMGNQVDAEDDAIHNLVVGLSTFIAIGATVAFLILSWVISRSIVLPVRGITGVMTALAGGDRAIMVPYADGHDEIAEMARSVQIFKDGLIRSEKLEDEARAAREEQLARSHKRELLTADFDVMIRRVIGKVEGAVESVHTTSTNLHAAAEQTSRQSSAVAAAAEEASSNIQTVASAAEELGASTQEISRRVQDTTRITQDAVDGVHTADATVEGLSTAAQKIGEIVGLITDIAAQTNLLALNATIEAARAGEAGKGFAVVAGEVKHLATQTAKATSEIAEQIGGIQSSTQNAVAAIKAVGVAIGRVDEVVSSIAAAVEEQNAATQEIVRNVQEAANGNQEVTSNISEVSSAAHMTGEMASTMFKVADELKVAGTSLGRHVETFLGSVKTV
ncbi:methyl-accepting chemotaxis protein [Paramagnetospirillum magneticum]|uniref:Methyl-accepting chemotaxis protein n=1 Tax=Paramagnetospirillum magneticum (strain ATCC 700264 / AMB-1) TaxID=342108 RepID=Q2W5D7_PARM1|nr:methyl-accepting chemotaxis protein [Paramagnetospirillum magneticum]BAE50938.1 Methyl-accepting chemotaxis protein [Paramagnetospirillum magneticum AMB-1]